MVVKQVDEAAKAFRGTWIGAGPVQQGYQLVVDVGTTWVGPCQHAANEAWLSQQAKQGCDHPALPHQLLHQGATGPFPARQLGRPFVVEGALGAVDQDHLKGWETLCQEQPGGGEAHHGTD